MSKNKFSFRNIPGWAVMLLVFGLLYFTGLHTEVMGQAQRLLISTGMMKPSLPETPAEPAVERQLVSNPGPMVGQGFKMRTLDGELVSFESLKGKVIFLNIWATWCPPCVAEMPNIQSLYEKVDTDKIAFVMLSVDQDGQEKVERFIDKKDFTFPVYMPASQIPQEFSSQAIPTTFIISPEGQIVARHEGMADYDTPEVKAFLEEMIP